ncbi:MAG: hypothetical protein KY464_08225 [Gemmatimonadetes bacterium]|nr:hypothetical protein [Gemmatimonadota bacterium]
MHILVTDILTCPRCGPQFGLIVLADRIEDRRVLTGGLGCANCRNEYPIREGIADLRFGLGGDGAEALAPFDAERAYRLAALSGVADRQGNVIVAGVDAAMLGEMARLLPNAQLLGFGSAAPGSAEGASWVLTAGGLPFRDRTAVAAVVAGSTHAADLPELARVVAPGGRLVLDGIGSEAGASLPANDWTLLLEQDGVAVASRNSPG